MRALPIVLRMVGVVDDLELSMVVRFSYSDCRRRICDLVLFHSGDARAPARGPLGLYLHHNWWGHITRWVWWCARFGSIHILGRMA